MLRVVFALAALLLVTQLSGVVTLVAEAACAGECSDDEAGGTCPPDCGACACCPHWKSIVAVRVATFVPPVATVLAWSEIPTLLTSADPQEILHIPRPFA